MKVLLVKPPVFRNHVIPILGLGYLAQAIRSRHQVEILDCAKEGINQRKFFSYLSQYQPDVVGFQCYSYDIHVVKKYASIARSIKNKPFIVIGGPHPTVMPKECMKQFYGIADFVLAGEGELSLPILLDGLSGGQDSFYNVPGLVWKNRSEIISNPLIFSKDLDALGFPAWDIIKPNTYPPAPNGAFFRQFPVAPIIVSRGCPYECTFCAAGVVSGKILRSRSITHVLEEVDELYNRYGIREIHILDDNFTLNRDFVLDFCDALVSKPYRLTWTCPNGIRLDTIDEECLMAMKRAGCYSLSIGIESASDRILQLIKKGTNIDIVLEKINQIKKNGMEVIGFFIIGFPSETREEMEQTIKFALDSGLDRAHFQLFHPLPRTEIYNKLLSKDDSKINWEAMSFSQVAYTPDGITHRELKNTLRKAFLRFYLKPKNLVNLIRDVNSLRHLSYILKRFFNWIVLP